MAPHFEVIETGEVVPGTHHLTDILHERFQGLEDCVATHGTAHMFAEANGTPVKEVHDPDGPTCEYFWRQY